MKVLLTEFQRHVDQRLDEALKDLRLHVDNRRIGWEEAFNRRKRESVIHISAQELEVRIREDSVSFTLAGKGDYYEMADYHDPDELANAFFAVLRERLSEQRQT